MKLWRSILILMLILGILPFTGFAQRDQAGFREKTKEVEIIFRVKWDGKVIPGISRVSELKRKSEVITHRSGAEPSLQRKSAGYTFYEPIVIERPRTSDTEFEKWANKVWNIGSGLGTESSLKDYRKDIRIELLTTEGTVVLAFNVYRCWPSEYVSLSPLDADDKKSLATEKLVLQHEGWERDYEIP
ncbi:MAG: phage tail protein [Calditrichia bacterium]